MTGRWKPEISAGALLLLALMYFFDGSGLLSAAAPAVCAHELGHLLALRLCARRLTRLRLGFMGLEMDYAPRLEGMRCALCALAGPLAGLVYALAACAAGRDFWLLSGALSLALTAFNLLPSLPLDGGRIAISLLPERVARAVSRVTALALLGFGVLALVSRRSAALLPAGLWLTACNFAARKRDL